MINGRFEWCGDLRTLRDIEAKDIAPLVAEGVAVITHYQQPRPGMAAYSHRYRVIVGPGFAGLAPSVRVEFWFDERIRSGRLVVGRNEQHVRMLYSRLCNGRHK